MNCSVQLNSSGDIELKGSWIVVLHENSVFWNVPSIMIKNGQDGPGWGWKMIKLFLKKDIARDPDIFYASPKANSTFFWFLGQHSVIVNAKNYHDEILPKTGFIGDLNVVYTILDKSCNWVLHNKAQVLRESGSSVNYAWNRCALVLQDNGKIKILAQGRFGPRKTLWSGLDHGHHSKDVLKAELWLENVELSLIHTFRDGIVHRFKTIKKRTILHLCQRNMMNLLV